MNRDDIIRMAREAGWQTGATSDDCMECSRFSLERFAALVAAAEREACAVMVDHILKEGGGTYGDSIRARGQA